MKLCKKSLFRDKTIIMLDFQKLRKLLNFKIHSIKLLRNKKLNKRSCILIECHLELNIQLRYSFAKLEFGIAFYISLQIWSNLLNGKFILNLKGIRPDKELSTMTVAFDWFRLNKQISVSGFEYNLICVQKLVLYFMYSQTGQPKEF